MLKLFLCSLLLFAIHQPAYASPSQATSLQGIQTLIAQGDSASAIQQLKQRVKTDPSHFQAWFLLGVQQAKARQFDDAIIAFKQVIALQPKLAEPHNNLAVIYNEIGDYRAAVQALEASLVLKPGYATAQENIGDLYIKLAADAYKKVLKAHDNPMLKARYQRLLNIRNNQAPAPIASRHVKKAPPTKLAHRKLIQKPVAVTQANALDILTSTSPSTPATQAVLQALEVWRLAWSKQDMQTYFASYSDEFQYDHKYPSLAKWKDYKTWAIGQRTFISVDIEQLTTRVLAGNVIKVNFLQHFKSDTFNSDNRKEMLFRHGDNGWKIIYEASM